MFSTLFAGTSRITDAIEKWILFFLLIGVASLVFVQVLLRYVFHAPLLGIEEILVFPTIWLYFLGCAHSSRDKTQIAADVFESLPIPRKYVVIQKMLSSLLSCLLSLWLTFWAYNFFRYSIKVWKLSPTLYIPQFYAESAVFISFVLMSLYIVDEFLSNSMEFLRLFRH